jgi:hypothetical protein
MMELGCSDSTVHLCSWFPWQNTSGRSSLRKLAADLQSNSMSSPSSLSPLPYAAPARNAAESYASPRWSVVWGLNSCLNSIIAPNALDKAFLPCEQPTARNRFILGSLSSVFALGQAANGRFQILQRHFYPATLPRLALATLTNLAPAVNLDPASGRLKPYQGTGARGNLGKASGYVGAGLSLIHI